MSDKLTFGKSLDDVFQSVVPADISGRLVKPYRLRDSDSEASQAQSIIEFISLIIFDLNHLGFKSGQEISKRIKEYTVPSSSASSSSQDSVKVDELIRVFTTSSGDKVLAMPNVHDYIMSVSSSKTSNDSLQYCDLTQVIGVNTKDSKKIPPITVIFCNTPMVAPQTRNAHAVSMFMNSVPSHIMSMAVPYLNAEFEYERPDYGDHQVFQRSMNNLKFLLGPSDKYSDVNEALKGAYYNQQVSADKTVKSVDQTFMDMFCSPQTLVSLDKTLSAQHYNPLIDQTRPLASLQNVSISITPTVGFMTYKKATMQIIVHDRSRLSDMADLIRPNEFPYVTCWMQYGWKLPSGVFTKTPNAKSYEDLFDLMLSPLEPYGVTNSSLSTDSTGQVSIQLELSTKSAMIARKLQLSFGGLNQLKVQLENAIETLKTSMDFLKLTPDTFKSKSIHTDKLLESAMSGAVPEEMKSQELVAAFNELSKSLNNNYNKEKSKDFQPVISNLLKAITSITGVTSSGN